MKQFIFVSLLLAGLVGGKGHAQGIANGVFLVAQPTLNDPTFRRTVILITQPPQSGPIGVIINRPTRVSASEALPGHQRVAEQAKVLHFGGPVQRRNLVLLVRSENAPPSALAVLRDVYLTSDADWVDAAIATASADEPTSGLSAVRVYAGYAGWARGQLQSELEREGWYVLPAESEYIFDKPAGDIWGELLKRAMLRNTHLSSEKIINKNN